MSPSLRVVVRALSPLVSVLALLTSAAAPIILALHHKDLVRVSKRLHVPERTFQATAAVRRTCSAVSADPPAAHLAVPSTAVATSIRPPRA